MSVVSSVGTAVSSIIHEPCLTTQNTHTATRTWRQTTSSAEASKVDQQTVCQTPYLEYTSGVCVCVEVGVCSIQQIGECSPYRTR